MKKDDEWLSSVRNSIKNLDELANVLDLTKEEQIQIEDKLPIRITPYYLNLIKTHPVLRKTTVPTINELIISPGESNDPLDEDKYNPTKCIVHKYGDRALFLVTNFCSLNCRFCTRSRIFDKDAISKKDIDAGIDYLKNTPTIRDVILSGGDPLTLSDEKLEYILEKVRAIKHIDIIRIGTKIPVVLPSRITDSLVNMLKKYHPLYMSIHFTHYYEITQECKDACNKLADAGIPLRSQTVLLKGVNDDVDTMKKLMQELLKIRVSPYYLYYPDYIIGSSHFRPSIDVGLSIIKELRKTTSGYCVPSLVIDCKYGKIIINPENIIENNDIIIKIKANNGEIVELKK